MQVPVSIGLSNDSVDSTSRGLLSHLAEQLQIIGLSDRSLELTGACE